MKNIIYCRVSHQKIHNDSFSIQEEKCTNYCKNKNMIIHQIHKEYNSGYGRQKILTEIINKYKNINLIISDVSRFSRSIAYGHTLFKICLKKNIILHFVKEEYILTPDTYEDSLFNHSLVKSENEWNNIRFNIINNIKMRRQNSMVLGKTPFGYDCINKKLEKNKDFNAIALIIYLRNGIKSVNEIREILKIFDSDISTFKFFDENENQILYFNKPFILGNTEIKNILNDCKVSNIEWTTNKINNIYKKYCNFPEFIEDTQKAKSIVFGSYQIQSDYFNTINEINRNYLESIIVI
jgi:DNA invertase Pin-like site-specific DNA recombinase